MARCFFASTLTPKISSGYLRRSLMDLPLNHNHPLVMHIDLNSCFATIEQQANPLLRNKPVVVAAYTTPSACVVAPSIEAKRYAITTGRTVRDARLLYPRVTVLPPDPPKYRSAHVQFSTTLPHCS